MASLVQNQFSFFASARTALLLGLQRRLVDGVLHCVFADDQQGSLTGINDVPEFLALRVEFFDVSAVVHFLRKVLWTVPDFRPETYDSELRRLHAQIERDGSFVSTARRILIEARRPPA